MTCGELIELLKQADGGDRTLDNVIHRFLHPELRGLDKKSDDVLPAHFYTFARKPWDMFMQANWRWEMSSDSSALVHVRRPRTVKTYNGVAKTPELALCIAMLQAIHENK